MTSRNFVLLSLLLLACAGAKPVPSSLASEHWVELKTEHFTVLTDESLDDAQKAGQYLERVRAALLGAAWPNAHLSRPDHLEVIVLSDDVAYHDLFSENVGGLYMGSNGNGRILLYGSPDHWEQRRTLAVEGSTSVLRHELAHHLAYFVGIQQPRWLAEGLAQFLETIQIKPDGSSAELGNPNLEALRLYNGFRTITVQDALDWSGPVDKYNQGPTAGRYGMSWAMVHWFYNAHPDAFANYQLALAQGKTANEAWEAVFPDLPPAKADREIHDYMTHGDYKVFTVPLPAIAEGNATHRALTPAEVHAVAARLALDSAEVIASRRPERLATMKQEVEAAVAADPTCIRALKIQFAMVPPDQRRALAERAVKAHPEDAAAWLMLGESMGETGAPEQQAAFLKASLLDRSDPTPLNAIAWGRAMRGEAQQALGYAEKAVRLAPADPAILDTYATVLAGLGKCHDAITVENRALSFLPEDATPKEFAEYRGRLEKFQHTCVPASAKSGP